MASWDEDDFTSPVAGVNVAGKGRWEGEDDEDDLPDEWDAESEEETPKPAPVALPQKPKRSVKQAIAEREERERKSAAEAALRKEQGLDLSDLDEDPRQRRERERAAELAADLESAKELISPPKISSPNGEQYDIATFRPQTKDEFEEFSKRLTTLITNFGDSPQYAMFVTGLVKAISEPLGSDDVKKVASGLTTLGNEKLKAERSSGGKSKKNAKKPTLVVGAVKSVAPKYDINNYDDDDFDDFMEYCNETAVIDVTALWIAGKCLLNAQLQ